MDRDLIEILSEINEKLNQIRLLIKKITPKDDAPQD